MLGIVLKFPVHVLETPCFPDNREFMISPGIEF
jgi:hypothetical protein